MPLTTYANSLEALALAFPVRFRFGCLGMTFEAVATIEGEHEACRLTIEADLGPVPFTAESPQARALRLALFNLNPGVADDRRFVERQHRLVLVTTTMLEASPSARQLVAAAAAQVLRCRAELALAAETAAVTARRAASRPPAPEQVPDQSQEQSPEQLPARLPPAAAEPVPQASAA